LYTFVQILRLIDLSKYETCIYFAAEGKQKPGSETYDEIFVLAVLQSALPIPNLEKIESCRNEN